MDWTAYKKILLDEFQETYPNRTAEEETAFYTAMTWLQNDTDLEYIKSNILESLYKKNPNLDAKTKKAFVYGLDRMIQVLNDNTNLSGRLNDYIPEKVHNEYLKKTLEGVKELVRQNEKLRDERNKAVNIMETFKTLSNSERKQLRFNFEFEKKEKQIEELKQEIERLKYFRDILNELDESMRHNNGFKI